MHFTLYSIGDSAFLEQILHAVAMITGTGDFKQLVGCGLLLGVLAVMAQSLLQGARTLPFQQVFMGWLVYACLFGPSCTVTIEDAYTGQVRVVSNAPIGVGLAGGIISNLGYSLTRLFETAYQPIAPGIASHGFAESLKVLNEIRRSVGQDIGLFNAWDKAIGGGEDGNGVNTRRSWITYIHECTLNKVDLINSREYTPVEKLLRQPIRAALHFPSRIHGTHLYLSSGNPQGEDMDCSQAWNRLQEATRYLNSPVVETYLYKQIGANPFQKMRNALDAVSQTGTSAIQYLQTALLEPLYYEAAAGRYRDFQDFSSALVVEQAIQQRNTQWAAEQSTFMTIVRPMMTFFEGLVYAITPLLAFLIVMGMFGIQLAGRYAQMLLWIQLWLPVLSIINLFIHMAATRAMASYTAAGLDSMYALDHASQVLQHWIATGGMLAAATPVISLFIVTGSSYVMTSLAGKVVGAEHIDENIQTPDIVKPAPFLGMQSLYRQDSFSGPSRTGAEQTFGSLDIGAAVSSGFQSAQLRGQQASAAFSHVLSRAFSEDVSQTQRYARIEALDRVFASQNSEDWQTANQHAKQFMDKAQVDAAHASKVRGAILAQMSGQAGAEATAQLLAPLAGTKLGGGGKLNLSGKAQGTTESAKEDQQTMSMATVTDFTKSVQSSHATSQRMQDQLARGYKTQSGQQFEHALGDALSEDYRQAAEQKYAAHQSFQQWAQRQSQFGLSQKVDLKTLGAAIANDPEASRLSWQAFYRLSPKDRQAVLQNEQWYQSYQGGAVNPAGARNIALMKQLSTLGKEGEIADIAGKALHQESRPTGVANAYSDLSAPSMDSSLPSQVQQATAPAAGLQSHIDRQSLLNKAHTGVSADAKSLSAQAPPDEIQQHAQAGQQSVIQQAHAMNQAVSKPEEDKAWSRLMAAPENPTLNVRSWGALDNMADWAAREYNRLSGAVEAGLGASFDSFDHSMSELHALTSEQRTAMSAQTNDQGAMAKGYDQAQAWMNTGTNLANGAQGLSLMQQGEYYASALWTALKAGPEHATQFWQQYGQQFKTTQQALAQSQFGLSDKQAALYTESLYSKLFDGNPAQVEAAARALHSDYPDRSAAEVNKMATVLQNAPRAGKQAGSFLAQTNLGGINHARRSTAGALK